MRGLRGVCRDEEEEEEEEEEVLILVDSCFSSLWKAPRVQVCACSYDER